MNEPNSVTAAAPALSGDSHGHPAVTERADPTMVNKAGDSAPGQTYRSGQGVTAIGDSMMIGVAPYLEHLLPGIVIDGQIGRQIAADDPRVTLVNWFSFSKDKDDLFYSDGVHLQPDGYQYYAKLLANAVQPAAPPDGSGMTPLQ